MQPTLLDGRYHITGVTFAHTEVTYYSAHDRVADQPVLVRVIDTSQAGMVGTGLEHLSADKLRRKMENEVKLLSTLHHARLLDLLGHGFDTPYYYHVYPHTDFQTLKHHIDRHGRLPVSEALRAVRGAADALATLHGLGLFHGDIMPEHILWDGAQAKLIEFAITNYEAEAGSIPGTPTYLSPEAVTGAPPAAPRDVWALGVTLAYALTGKLAFGEARPAQVPVLFSHILQAEPDLGDDLPPAVRELLGSMLTKDPSARATLDSVRAALTHLFDEAGG
jgi:serine/threonine protein kinase